MAMADPGCGGGRPSASHMRLARTYGALVWQFACEHPALAVTCAAIALTLAPVQDVLLPHLYGEIVNAISGPGG